jgi:hypothetical protein
VRWALALIVVTVAAVVVALVVAVRATGDPVPDRLRRCVEAGQAQVVRSEGDLGAQVRSDIGAGALRTVARQAVGDDTVVLLQGTRYRVLVLAARKSPPLTAGLPLRVFQHADAFALVAKETAPSRGVLADCVALASGA